MSKATVEQLIAADSRLTWSFVGYLIAVFGPLAWSMFAASPTPAAGPSVAAVVLVLVAIGLYVWYALSAGAAAKLLGDAGWKYAAWILAAPLLAAIPIPLVSTVIGASPLAIKFLLGSQLQSAIHQATVSDLHPS